MPEPRHISKVLETITTDTLQRQRSAVVGLSGGSDSERNLAERPGDASLSRGQVSEWAHTSGKTAVSRRAAS